MATQTQDKAQLLPLYASLRSMARIFFSLNWQTIPEFFEDNMSAWMTEFHKFLANVNPLLVDPDEDDEPGPNERVQTAIVENLKLYAEKYEEEFQPCLSQFTQAVWTLLVKLEQVR